MAVGAHRLFEQSWPEGEYRFAQLGFVVDDLLATATRWVQVFGVGPFHVLPRRAAPCRYRGAESTVDLQVAVAQAGPVQIELICDHSEGPTVFRDLAARPQADGIGFHQVSTLTADYDGKVAHYRSLGYEPACELTAPGQRIAFIDTLADFGFYTEVVEDTAAFRAQVAAISATCANWDGTDPIRILTRDGYRTP
ncbi:VOC family protein [Mycolicibacterium thermoresistibile]